MDDDAHRLDMTDEHHQLHEMLRSMRVDLERVAVFSDESFRSAQEQLVHLASYNKPTE